ISKPVARLITNLLEKNPRKRFKNATELEEYLAGISFEQPSLDPLEQPISGSVSQGSITDDAPSPATVEPTEQRPAPGRVLPPSIAPKSYRPHPDRPAGRR